MIIDTNEKWLMKYANINMKNDIYMTMWSNDWSQYENEANVVMMREMTIVIIIWMKYEICEYSNYMATMSL